jgi:hypothetical protein
MKQGERAMCVSTYCAMLARYDASEEEAMQMAREAYRTSAQLRAAATMGKMFLDAIGGGSGGEKNGKETGK